MKTTPHSGVDTIYAVSTALGKSAIAVMRVSGPDTEAVLERICKRSAFQARRATLAPIFDEDGSLLDRGLVIRFFRPNSFTGEDMIEFHVTGGRAVVLGLQRALAACPGTRAAEAGEFARRAFRNGKIDLAEVEGLASIVQAETKAQLRHAMTMAYGELSRRSERVRGFLLDAMAQIEAMLDFSDEEEASEITIYEVLPTIREAETELAEMLLGAGVSERLKDGMTVVIAGPPNVGKSTLLNYLAHRDIAIVSPIAGTTRDALEISAELGGFPVVFVDTAGIHDASDEVEAEGVARARRWGERADLVLWLTSNDDERVPPEVASWRILPVRTKADLIDNQSVAGFAISARTGAGVDALILKVMDLARDHFAEVGRVYVGTDRQYSAAKEAADVLRCVLDEPLRPTEVIAEDLRVAARALARISGRIEVEEVLGEIFSRLCVGK